MNITQNSSQETPVCNTGYDLQRDGFSVGVDWLDFTLKNINSIEAARDRLADIEAITSDPVAFQPWQPIFNGHAWDGQGKGIHGTQIWYLASRVDECCRYHPGQLKIALSGSVLARCDIAVLALYLQRNAIALDIACQRIDIALDDLEKFVNLDDIADAHEHGNFFNASYSAVVSGGKRGEIKGKTIYFGSPSSDKRLRAYDKFIESKGAKPGNRLEGQFRRKPADMVFHQWIEAQAERPDSVPRLLQNFVLGLIDFRKRGPEDTARERCSLLDWYADLCNLLRASPARIVAAKVEQSIQRSIDWIDRSVSQSLATIKITLGSAFDDYIGRMIKAGGERLNNKKRYLGETTDRQQLIY